MIQGTIYFFVKRWLSTDDYTRRHNQEQHRQTVRGLPFCRVDTLQAAPCPERGTSSDMAAIASDSKCRKFCGNTRNTVAASDLYR